MKQKMAKFHRAAGFSVLVLAHYLSVLTLELNKGINVISIARASPAVKKPSALKICISRHISQHNLTKTNVRCHGKFIQVLRSSIINLQQPSFLKYCEFLKVAFMSFCLRLKVFFWTLFFQFVVKSTWSMLQVRKWNRVQFAVCHYQPYKLW